MHLSQLHLTQVRQFERETVSFNPGFNLLIGENGAGKTTLLRAIWAVLGTQKGRTPIILDDDIRFLGNELHIETEVVAPQPNNLYVSRLEKKLGKRAKRNSFSDTYDSRLPPLVLYYSSTEASCSSFAHRKSRKFYLGGTSNITEKEEELYQAERRRIINPNLTERFGSSRSVRDFVIRILSQFSDKFRDFSWRFEPYDFRIRPPYSNKLPLIRRKLIGAISKYFQESPNLQLGSIDQTHIIINSQGHLIGESKTTPMIPPFRELLKSVDIDSDTVSKLEDCTVEVKLAPRIQIRSQSGTLFLNQLSDGEQRLFSLFVDIARQLEVQSMERNIDTSFAIILIDEIDVHLHPKWQRMVVPLLKDLFPACQFIATTHSPFVIQALGTGKLVQLGDGASDLDPSGESIEDIAEDIQGIEMSKRSYRDERLAKATENYYRLLNSGTNQRAKEFLEAENEFRDAGQGFSTQPGLEAVLKFEAMAAIHKI
jgi:predicted ATP-binding protein involved in virulence